ncbi:Uncharacterized membrane protein YcaP, DUF421 family [Amphibacillus marinus]|uniref:Uncharacterized membrane protein YcaP, DUF421 family n=1 Tax=Amphibacillus marinus TaxID=872970 RepID=A0A1H8NZN9_9BACI|nr:DUF421 domain-containing protein [Amphibacillus marinus]SEO35072.1 Uncharacterized membrane protein YcaP, DUF421 family [Amphibacillus marinus]
MWLIILRTFMTYGFIVVFFRLMGKREIGELSLLDIVIFMMMAEIAVFAIEDPKAPLWEGVVPMLLLVLIQRASAFFSLKSKRFRDWFEGKPSLIIANGQIDENEMKKQRYNFDDLTQQLHEKGVKGVQDVEFAILEPSGKLSVFEKENPVSTGFVYLLITDGEVQKDALTLLNKSEQWLKAELAKRGFFELSQISYCTIDSAEKWFIDIKNER